MNKEIDVTKKIVNEYDIFFEAPQEGFNRLSVLFYGFGAFLCLKGRSSSIFAMTKKMKNATGI